MDQGGGSAAVTSGWRMTLAGRLRATGIHFAISLAIFAVAMYLILAHWYPGFHFNVDGGWQGTRIMVGVDLVLGPLLTLIIFNPLKARRLIAFDLTCIGLIQLAALVWGFYAIHSQRPVSVNFFEGEFHSITAEPIRMEEYELSILDGLSDRTPALVYVASPTTDNEVARAAMLEVMGGVLPHEDPIRFKPYAPNRAAVLAAAQDAATRGKSDASFAAALEAFLARHGGTAADYRYVPYNGRYGTCTAVLTAAAGDWVDAIGCRGY